MFQYAAGRALSLRLNTELKLDITGFEDYTLHGGYGLNNFALQPEYAMPEEIKLLRGSNGIRSRIFRRIGLSSPTYIKEKNLAFNPAFYTLNNNSYIDGYWQSEKYFKNYANIIRQDFMYTMPLSDKNQPIKKLIMSCNSVSVHIRRGDYIANSQANKFHGVCSLDYYKKASQLIAQKLDTPVFFIFSDDISWCKSNLNLDFPTFFIETATPSSPYEDMHLMSLCSHHIIANSTFSWWGAWLNPNTNKLVIAPKQWFANPKIKNPDILPDNWLSI